MSYPPVPYPPIAGLASSATPSEVKANSPSLNESPPSPTRTNQTSSPPLATPTKFRSFVFPRPSPQLHTPPTPYSDKSDFFLLLGRTRTIESPPSSSPSKQGSFGKFRPPKKVVKEEDIERETEESEEEEEEEDDDEVRQILERRKRMKLEGKVGEGVRNDAQVSGLGINDDGSDAARRNHKVSKVAPSSPCPNSPSLASTARPLPHQIPFNHPRIINPNVSARQKANGTKKSGKDAESSEDELMTALDELISGNSSKGKRKRGEE